MLKGLYLPRDQCSKGLTGCEMEFRASGDCPIDMKDLIFEKDNNGLLLRVMKDTSIVKCCFLISCSATNGALGLSHYKKRCPGPGDVK